MADTPMDALLAKVDWKCGACGAKAGTCNCWSQCPESWCGYSVLKGKKCGNPGHDDVLMRFYSRFRKDVAEKMTETQWAAWLERLPDDEWEAIQKDKT